MYSVQELVGTAEVTQGRVGPRGPSPARPRPRWPRGERPKLLRYSATRALPPAAPGSAAAAPRPGLPPRLRPRAPVGLSPLLWRQRAPPQVSRQMKARRGQRQPGELRRLLGPRLQGWLPLTHSAQVLSVSSWWWWHAQLSVGGGTTNWTQTGTATRKLAQRTSTLIGLFYLLHRTSLLYLPVPGPHSYCWTLRRRASWKRQQKGLPSI